MKKQAKTFLSEEQEQVAARRAPVLRCECCGALVRRRSWFTALYTLLCRVCWLAETSGCQEEGMYEQM